MLHGIVSRQIMAHITWNVVPPDGVALTLGGVIERGRESSTERLCAVSCVRFTRKWPTSSAQRSIRTPPSTSAAAAEWTEPLRAGERSVHGGLEWTWIDGDDGGSSMASPSLPSVASVARPPGTLAAHSLADAVLVGPKDHRDGVPKHPLLSWVTNGGLTDTQGVAQTRKT